MNLSFQQQTDKPARRRELDFLRGVALIVMTLGHPLRTDLQTYDVDVLRYYYNIYGELFSALFMFMSAINVTNFLRSAARHPDLDATRFYLKSSAALFVLGSTYNMIVGTLVVIDIIQAIAVGTLVVYLLLRFRVPTLVIAALTAALFGVGWWLVGPWPVGPETMEGMGPLFYLTAMFGPIPWVGFFTYGIIVDRIPRRFEVPAIVFFAAVFAGAHALPPISGEVPAIFLFKANPRYVVMALGLLPVLHLGCRRWYRGATKAGRVVEYWGTESLVFLVFHWFFLYLLQLWEAVISLQFGETLAVWAVGVVTLILMGSTVHLIAAKRDAWLKRPDFPKKAWRVFWGSLIGWAFMMSAALRMAATPAGKLPRFLALGCAFGAAFSFTFLYPYLRAQLRRRSMRKAAA
ncbi:MAG: DUF1624 domain-containing protein [Deltaproteobacteria bacterium]|nr:DUF1624 domain-containing protein [Deltaproteobacteria bacterium]